MICTETSAAWFIGDARLLENVDVQVDLAWTIGWARAGAHSLADHGVQGRPTHEMLRIGLDNHFTRFPSQVYHLYVGNNISMR